MKTAFHTIFSFHKGIEERGKRLRER